MDLNKTPENPQENPTPSVPPQTPPVTPPNRPTPTPSQIPPAGSFAAQYASAQGTAKGNTQAQSQRDKTGFAIAALVLGIVSLIGVCCCLNVITAPLAIIFGIVALVKKQGGTGMSVTGIVLAALSLIVIGAFLVGFKDIMPYSEQIVKDYSQLIEEQDEVFPAYEQDGTLPEYLEKYKEPPYSELLEKYEITIYDVMDALLVNYKNGSLKNVSVPAVPEDSEPADAILIYYAFAG